MRILHISDLHFGHQNQDLLDNLQARVPAIAPDLILATGDFAHHARYHLFTKARDYLNALRAHCPPPTNGAARPNLIAVPGNHDCGLFGIIPMSGAQRAYHLTFGAFAKHHYFAHEQVWVYGFNSARAGWNVKTNGKVLRKDLLAFQAEHQRLTSTQGQGFKRAFKIVALHHHPVPVAYSAKKSRWLSLLNAGEFLEEMLKHDIDLIVHGHEHVHAQASFGKRINGIDKRLTVVSVGTASDKEPGDHHNRFNVIHIEPAGAVMIDSYSGQGALFGMEAVDRFAVRAQAHAQEHSHRHAIEEKGYEYARVDVSTTLNAEGDALRSADFRGLKLHKTDSDRAKEHRIVLPETSGYIDLTSAWEISKRPIRPLAHSDTSRLAGKSADVTIDYGAPVRPGDSIAVRCQWWGVNAMAMSKSQYSYKYAENTYEELTHFPIVDPIDELVWTVTFPKGFVVDRLEAYVASMTPVPGDAHTYTRDITLEQRLDDSIDFDPALNRAYLRIRRPLIGYSYGVRWTVPDDAAEPGGGFSGDIAQIVDRLVQHHDTRDEPTKEKLSHFLLSLAQFVRDTLAEQSNSPIEVEFMVFDRDRRRMITPCAVTLEGDRGEWVDRRAFVLAYGEGLGGRVFKTREVRLYSRSNSPKRDKPDYYRHVPGGPDHAILLSIPIHHPKMEHHVYAVLNCGSPSKASPLGKLGSGTGGAVIPAEQLGVIWAALNQICYTGLSEMFGH